MMIGWGGGIIIMGLFIWLIITWINRTGNSPTNQYPPKETPLEILKNRYAGGEINKEEFEEKKKGLM